ncbi:hypothetical protein MRX96_050459 [Rhipicephalus microplus]
MGQAEVPIEYNGQLKIVPVVVVPGNKPALHGPDRIVNPDIDLNGLHTVHLELSADKLMKRYASVFTPGLGLIKGFQAKLSLKTARLPVLCKEGPSSTIGHKRTSYSKIACKMTACKYIV